MHSCWTEVGFLQIREVMFIFNEANIWNGSWICEWVNYFKGGDYLNTLLNLRVLCEIKEFLYFGLYMKLFFEFLGIWKNIHWKYCTKVHCWFFPLEKVFVIPSQRSLKDEMQRDVRNLLLDGFCCFDRFGTANLYGEIHEFTIPWFWCFYLQRKVLKNRCCIIFER